MKSEEVIESLRTWDLSDHQVVAMLRSAGHWQAAAHLIYQAS